MRERPIALSRDEVRGVLAGRITMIRRIMEPQPYLDDGFWHWAGAGWSSDIRRVYPMLGHSMANRCPFGEPGDHLWVKERWVNNHGAKLLYHADFEPGSYEYGAQGWKSPSRMPRKYSRITLELHNRWSERVQSIRDEDFVPSGFPYSPDTYEEGFAATWERTHGDGTWDRNDWVWVASFERLQP